MTQTNETKTCKECKATKPTTDYYPRHSLCKPCRNKRTKIYLRTYYLKNREKLKARTKKFYHENKEKLQDRANIYYINNAEKVRERRRVAYAKKTKGKGRKVSTIETVYTPPEPPESDSPIIPIEHSPINYSAPETTPYNCDVCNKPNAKYFNTRHHQNLNLLHLCQAHELRIRSSYV